MGSWCDLWSSVLDSVSHQRLPLSLLPTARYRAWVSQRASSSVLSSLEPVSSSSSFWRSQPLTNKNKVFRPPHKFFSPTPDNHLIDETLLQLSAWYHRINPPQSLTYLSFGLQYGEYPLNSNTHAHTGNLKAQINVTQFPIRWFVTPVLQQSTAFKCLAARSSYLSTFSIKHSYKLVVSSSTSNRSNTNWFTLTMPILKTRFNEIKNNLELVYIHLYPNLPLALIILAAAMWALLHKWLQCSNPIHELDSCQTKPAIQKQGWTLIKV